MEALGDLVGLVAWDWLFHKPLGSSHSQSDHPAGPGGTAGGDIEEELPHQECCNFLGRFSLAPAFLLPRWRAFVEPTQSEREDLAWDESRGCWREAEEVGWAGSAGEAGEAGWEAEAGGRLGQGEEGQGRGKGRLEQGRDRQEPLLQVGEGSAGWMA